VKKRGNLLLNFFFFITHADMTCLQPQEGQTISIHCQESVCGNCHPMGHSGIQEKRTKVSASEGGKRRVRKGIDEVKNALGHCQAVLSPGPLWCSWPKKNELS
jgi:hypothetical protein